MENKDTYTLKEVQKIILLDRNLNEQDNFLSQNYQNPFQEYDKKIAKAYAMKTFEGLPLFEEIPKNIRKGLCIESKLLHLKELCKMILLE